MHVEQTLEVVLLVIPISADIIYIAVPCCIVADVLTARVEESDSRKKCQKHTTLIVQTLQGSLPGNSSCPGSTFI